jgi:transcriptional regulator with XRE-family HTH domain
MFQFGARLREIREQRGWSQQELAERSGVTYMTIWRFEAGRHKWPRMDIARKLAKTLGVSLDALCGLYEDAEEDTPAHHDREMPCVLTA